MLIAFLWLLWLFLSLKSNMHIRCGSVFIYNGLWVSALYVTGQSGGKEGSLLLKRTICKLQANIEAAIYAKGLQTGLLKIPPTAHGEREAN